MLIVYPVVGQELHKKGGSGYENKTTSESKALVIRIWGVWGAPSLLLVPCPLWPEVVVPKRVLSMEKIDLIKIIRIRKDLLENLS